MIKNIICLVILLALCPVTALAQQHAIEKALDDYNRAPSAETANRFFSLLDQEEFTEEKIHFSTQVPADSVRQQVWYWASE